MFYISTRNENIHKSAAEAILMGIADDGGLYVPNDLKSARFPMETLRELNDKEQGKIYRSRFKSIRRKI